MEEIPGEKRAIIKIHRKLACDFRNDLFYAPDFDISIDCDIDYWRHRYEEEFNEKEQGKKEKQERDHKIQAKKDNIVDLTCCTKCAKTCCLCGKRDNVLKGSNAHKTCLLFPKMYLICGQKTTDINPFVGFCPMCKFKYNIENKVHWAACRQPLM